MNDACDATWFETTACPLCGCSEGRVAHCVRETLSYRNLPDGLVFNVVECRECQLKYVSPRLRKEMLHKVYAEDLYGSYGTNAHYRPKVNLHHDIYHDNLPQRLASYSHFCDVLQAIGVKGSAFEVGSSFGYLLDMLRSRGFSVAGVELSRYTHEFSRQTFGFEDVWCGDFLGLDLGGRRFDLIVLWHVFEHLHEPNQILAKCGELLAPGGVVMITCPFHEVFTDEHINPVEHLYYMQKTHIRGFLERAFPCETWVENPFVFARKTDGAHSGGR